MLLNHLNLTVENVPETQAFLTNYFGLNPVGGGNANIAFLTDENGTFISLIRGRDVQYPDTFHIGFRQASDEAVNELHRQLVEGGFEVEAPHRAHGSWTFYFNSPGKFVIEVLH